MSATLKLDGVRQMLETLESLPEDLSRRKLGPIVRDASEGFAAELKSSYAKKTGDLADRVMVEKGSDPNGLLARVRSKSPTAHLYEYGTVARFTNETGAARGSMPAKATFVPGAVRWRERMIRATKDALQGLRIPGFTGSPEVRES